MKPEVSLPHAQDPAACHPETEQSSLFNFERVHPVVFTLMYWIDLLPSTQQTISYNGFTTTYFNSHELSSGYVQNLLVLAVLLLTVLEVVGRYEVVAVLTLI
jgi:hypothetical protein